MMKFKKITQQVAFRFSIQSGLISCIKTRLKTFNIEEAKIALDDWRNNCPFGGQDILTGVLANVNFSYAIPGVPPGSEIGPGFLFYGQMLYRPDYSHDRVVEMLDNLGSHMGTWLEQTIVRVKYCGQEWDLVSQID